MSLAQPAVLKKALMLGGGQTRACTVELFDGVVSLTYVVVGTPICMQWPVGRGPARHIGSSGNSSTADIG